MLWSPMAKLMRNDCYHVGASSAIFLSLEFPNLGFFKAPLPDSRLLKSPNPVSRSKLQSRISSPFLFKIPNPGLEISQIPDPEKPIGDPVDSDLIGECCNLICRFLHYSYH